MPSIKEFSVMFNYFCFLTLLQLALGETIFSNNTELNENEHINYGNILCRGCGSDIASSDEIVLKPSPLSQYSSYDSLFGLDDILVQLFLSDYFFIYAIVTTRHSTCVGVGEWQEKDTWFPGYKWKPCICPDCGDYIGFIFEPIDYELDSVDSFYGLILEGLVDLSLIDSLTILPKEKTNYDD